VLLVQPDTLQNGGSKSLDHLLTRVGVKIGEREWAIWCVEDQDVLLSLVSGEGDAPYGLLLWESAVALAHELEQRPQLVAGRRVLELGAGVGLPGLVARRLGAHVYQTDKAEEALRVAARNERENGLSGIERFLADWTKWTHSDHYDVIIGADILYETKMQSALASIVRRSIAPHGTVLVADPGRPQAIAFLSKLEDKGARFGVTVRCVPPTSPLGSGEETQVLLCTWTPSCSLLAPFGRSHSKAEKQGPHPA
jgi:methyltransferase-like protein 23